MVGTVRGLEGRARDLGRDRARRGRRLWRVKRRGATWPSSWTPGAPALLVAQSIGRVGNWFNQELFGKPTTCRGAWRSTPSTGPTQYADQPTFHPVFLYEIIWNLALAAALVRLREGSATAGLFALYVAGYSAFGSSPS
jgi:prolipoprotein diacylglyceryltransferase